MSVRVSAEANFDFTEITQETKRELSKEVVRSATNIDRNAKRKVNVDHGRLRSSIHVKYRDPPEPVDAEVIVGADYGKFLEFGTGPRGRDSDLNAMAEQARQEMGYQYGPAGKLPPIDVFLDWGRRKRLDPAVTMAIWFTIGMHGMRAKPFLFPAASEEREAFFSRVNQALDRIK